MSKANNPPHKITLEEEIELLKSIRSRGLVPLITEEELPNVPRLSDVQGDVMYRFPKYYERFIFFRIKDRGSFKRCLHYFNPTSAQDVKDNLLKIAKAKQETKRAHEEAKRMGQSQEGDDENPEQKVKRVKLQQYLIAFSRSGLNFLGVDEETGDERFDKRTMRDDKRFLDDRQKWADVFDKQRFDEVNGSVKEDEGALHGVIAVATDNERHRDEADDDLVKIFGKSWTIPKGGRIDGMVRPKPYRHHEHFGYKDGISQPALRGLDHPLPGQIQVDPGVIVMGYPGDPVPNRPEWTKNGSMLVFRKLQQSVILFEKYIKDQGPRWKEFCPGGEEVAENIHPPLTDEEGAELFGARFVGRWKSGAPLPLAPFRDNPELGADPKRNNDFDYVVRDVPGVSCHAPSDYYCPFTAHSRKTAPRNLDPFVSRQYLESSSIARAGIPYGPEVTQKERLNWKPPPAEETDRGLLFVCYASHLDSGFVRQSIGYGNNDFFPITDLKPIKHGQDPIIGGPPIEGSSNELRKISIGKVVPIKTAAALGQVESKTAVDRKFEVIDGGQVHLEFEVPTHCSASETFQISGFVATKPQEEPIGADNPFFVTSRGGEYFFVPSIPTLKSWASPH